ncbi:MAG: DUF177 domain-containing protein [Bacteroidia bacterium]|jgi:uncharacterized metal-binding protein YceD (DUF177 family)|nr:DUF177 domain-containing protein [Bacteroidia bacterium]
MKALKEFEIPFSGLKDGNHSYTFELDRSFFEAFPYGETENGKVDAQLELFKRPDMLTLDFTLKGEVELICDRCGELYSQPVYGKRQLVVNLNADSYNDEDDLITLPASAHSIDTAHWFYEFVMLLLPAKRVHPNNANGTSGCDPEMLARINQLAAPETPPQSDDDDTDPRWDALKNLKFD